VLCDQRGGCAARPPQAPVINERRLSLNLGKGTKDHPQQEGEEAVVGDVVHASKGYEGQQNQLHPSWEFIDESIYGP